ncbi:MAGE family-domain-containing protein [Bisporella sp. PMI_857]|nr:MAGE family-domain-containing protein [Bisporella sp. PMI_857]
MPSARRRRAAADDDESSQEDSRPTQRRRQSPSDGEEDEDLENADALDEGQEGDEQAVKKLVRYALACEYQRKPIRRADITEKVFMKKRIPFKRIFDLAQGQLREKFGMMMVELPTKEKITMKEKRAAQKSKGGSTSSSSYILTTILPLEYRTAAIIPPSNVISTIDEASYVALCTMVVSLIALSPQGQCLEAKLLRYLGELNIDENMLGEKTPLMLKRMANQGYIHRVVEKTSDDETVNYVVGPRGKVEVGNHGTIGLVNEVYGEAAPNDLEERLRRSLQMEVGKANRLAKGERKVELEQEEEEDNGGPSSNTKGQRSGRQR